MTARPSIATRTVNPIPCAALSAILVRVYRASRSRPSSSGLARSPPGGFFHCVPTIHRSPNDALQYTDGQRLNRMQSMGTSAPAGRAYKSPSILARRTHSLEVLSAGILPLELRPSNRGSRLYFSTAASITRTLRLLASLILTQC